MQLHLLELWGMLVRTFEGKWSTTEHIWEFQVWATEAKLSEEDAKYYVLQSLSRETLYKANT